MSIRFYYLKQQLEISLEIFRQGCLETSVAAEISY